MEAEEAIVSEVMGHGRELDRGVRRKFTAISIEIS